jgi:hypothetical protein
MFASLLRSAALVAAGLLLATSVVAAQESGQAAPPPLKAETAEEASPPAPPIRFYFFSPDWRPADLGKLAAGVEDVLKRERLEVTFQAFTRYEDFAKQVAEKPPHFLLAPAWMEAPAGSGIAAGLDLKVLARPQRHGRSGYRKALMTRAGIDSIDDLAHGSIAATVWSMGAGSDRSILDAFHLAADSAKVVPVPKDVDALLALSFAQVDAALVTGLQYELLAATNPVEAESLRVLAFSPEIALPPVFSCAGADAELAVRLPSVLAGFASTDEGRQVLALLGFDAFVPEPQRATKGTTTKPHSKTSTPRTSPPR